LTKIIREDGYDALCVEITREYENGNFQPGIKNKFSQAAERLKRHPDYKKYDWHALFADQVEAVIRHCRREYGFQVIFD